MKNYYNYKLRDHITPKKIVDMARAIRSDLKTAIDLKAEFYEAVNTMIHCVAKDFFPNFIHRLKHLGVLELREVVKRFKNWQNEIINVF